MKLGRRLYSTEERTRTAIGSMVNGTIGGDSKIGMPIVETVRRPLIPSVSCNWSPLGNDDVGWQGWAWKANGELWAQGQTGPGDERLMQINPDTGAIISNLDLDDVELGTSFWQLTAVGNTLLLACTNFDGDAVVANAETGAVLLNLGPTPDDLPVGLVYSAAEDKVYVAVFDVGGAGVDEVRRYEPDLTSPEVIWSSKLFYTANVLSVAGDGAVWWFGRPGGTGVGTVVRAAGGSYVSVAASTFPAEAPMTPVPYASTVMLADSGRQFRYSGGTIVTETPICVNAGSGLLTVGVSQDYARVAMYLADGDPSTSTFAQLYDLS